MDGYEGRKGARGETYCEMWTTTFCPNFSCSSFTSVLVVAQILVYVTMVIHTTLLEAGLNDLFFLGIQVETLDKFGLRIPYKIQ
jgi:hypothetical protein